MRGSRADLLQLRWRSGEEYPHERALTQPRIQLGDRSVDQEQNEDPNLDSGNRCQVNPIQRGILSFSGGRCYWTKIQ
jgi:hypothetical protein